MRFTQQEIKQFQKEIYDARIEFEFEIYSLNELLDYTQVDEIDLHKKALRYYFKNYEKNEQNHIQQNIEHINERLLNEHNAYTKQVLLKNLEKLKLIEPHNAELATKVQLDSHFEIETSWLQAQKQQYLTWFDYFVRAFFDPPYSTNVKNKDEQISIFTRFCKYTGLNEHAEIYDWVGCGGEYMPDRSQWSYYFEAGREWWGNWCLTVLNQECQTMAVIIASTTD